MCTSGCSGPADVTRVTDPSRGRAGGGWDGRAGGAGVRQGREHQRPGTGPGRRRRSVTRGPRERHPRAGPVGRVRGPHRPPERGLGRHRAGRAERRRRDDGRSTAGRCSCRRRRRHPPRPEGHRSARASAGDAGSRHLGPRMGADDEVQEPPARALRTHKSRRTADSVNEDIGSDLAHRRPWTQRPSGRQARR